MILTDSYGRKTERPLALLAGVDAFECPAAFPAGNPTSPTFLTVYE